MADKPILYSGPMVRAQLAGTKSQTRRGLVLRRYRGYSEFGPSDTQGYDWHLRDREKRWHDLRHAELLKLLPWQVGDRLYVRELWRTHAAYDDISPAAMAGDEPILYAADGAHQTWGYPAITKVGRLRQGMHMPRWATRITNIVTDVRVQRLQDISEDDASDEGIAAIMMRRGPTALDVTLDLPGNPSWLDPRPSDVYSSLWDSINGPGSWDANPWVAAYTFTVHLGNIDTMPEIAAA